MVLVEQKPKRPQPFAVTVTDYALPSERNMIVSSWRHGMEDSPEGDMRPGAYRAWFNSLAAHYLGEDEGRIELPARCSLLTARREDRPSFVVSWMLVERTTEGLAVHYVSTKGDFRGCGFGGLLLGAALEMADGGEVYYTVRPRKRVELWFAKYGMVKSDIARFTRVAGAAE